MSPLTPWHYLLIGSLAFVFVVSAVLAFRSDSKGSILTAVGVFLGLIGGYGWYTINQSVYLVELSHIDEERFYQSEQILIKGVVRNVGNYPVSHVVATVQLINSQGANDRKASQFAQPTAFAELFEGDDPAFKRNNVIEEHVIADSLAPGHSKVFRILMDYPPYFKRASYDVTAQAN